MLNKDFKLFSVVELEEASGVCLSSKEILLFQLFSLQFHTHFSFLLSLHRTFQAGLIG